MGGINTLGASGGQKSENENLRSKTMRPSTKNLRTCPNGHNYYKSSDCPTCPICENERKPKEGFLSLLVAPARRALENKGITTLKKLTEYTEDELLLLHGLGKSSIPKLKKALLANGLSFKKNSNADTVQ